ncbi:hypothetical protein DVH24_018578 [Malus domestica]|uniref:Uncharacterized protein n=1 Tax=Malus domestica TaxID=3750 RepID=A0A498HQV2_MALDO|nr:hypothetical protein DVH24_018578 [Malus domestica]
MSKFPHETKGYNAEFHGWYNMKPPPLPGLLKANPTSSFSSVDSVMLLKSIDQKTKADMSGEMITFLNFELFQKHRGHIDSYERSQDGNVEIEEERNKGFEDSRRLVKGNEPRQP